MRTSLLVSALLVSTSTTATTVEHEHPRKSVAFPLEAETDYWIELSGSPTADPVLLITPDR